MRQTACLALALAAGLSVAGVVAAEPKPNGQAPAAAGQQAHAAPGHGAHWGYSGAAGPQRWGELAADYQLCRDGRQQSPIDVAQPNEAGLSGLDFRYRPTPLRIVNNGHTVQVNYAGGSIMRTGLHEYELLQFHVHSPSEHTIGGEAAPMEIHLVHRDDRGELGVVGVMVVEGQESLALSEIWRHLPPRADGEHAIEGVVINARDLLPWDTGYFAYMGSLTTPPCSEGVHWHLMSQPIEASAQQIRRFVELLGPNARPVQPRNGRFLIQSSPPAARAPSAS